MEKNKDISFEEALAGLEKTTELLKSDNVPLDTAINTFEEGIKYYEKCNEILASAKQKIEVYSK